MWLMIRVRGGRGSTCVPDLSLDSLSIYLDAAGGKLHANGALALKIELVSCEP